MLDLPLSRVVEGARVAALIAQIEDDEIEFWARVHMVAAAIPADVDLDDETDVVRALFAARMACRDFADVLTEAIDIARERRAS